MIVVDAKALPTRAKLHREPVIPAGYVMTIQTNNAVSGLLERLTWLMRAIDDDVSEFVQQYAQHWWTGFASRTDASNAVAAPVGAWLLVALASGATATRRCTALGLQPERAEHIAAALLERAPEALRAATAVWIASDQRTIAFDDWQQHLPPAVACGPVPTSQQADAWAHAATDGLISRFPVAVTRETALVLVNALAADVRWRRPYLARPSDDWGVGRRWAGRVQSVLVGDDLTAVRTDQGLFAVHQAQAEGLIVLCVTGIPESAGMAAAAEVARAYLGGASEDLWSLPLGEQGCWQIAEEPLEDAPAERVLRTEARVPAWEAESTWDLMAEPELGFVDAAQRISVLLADPGPAQAVQCARARFDRLGFTASAVTALAIMRSAPPRDREPKAGVLRKVRVDFAEPFAAFAFVDEPDSPWHHVMAFAAWVAEPTEPTQV